MKNKNSAIKKKSIEIGEKQIKYADVTNIERSEVKLKNGDKISLC